MAVYRPTYTDKKTGETRQSKIWWYDFTFAGKRIQRSSKSARKTIAVEAEKKARKDLEKGFNAIEDVRAVRISSVSELAATYLEDYTVRHPKSATFAEHASRHVTRLLGRMTAFEIDEQAVKSYQTARLKEGASPKSINEEIGVLIRMLPALQGDTLRFALKRRKHLKLKQAPTIARAFSPEEMNALLSAARGRRSKVIYPALALALNTGLRDAELRGLQWERIDLGKALLHVADSKTDAGAGRPVPLNVEVLGDLKAHAEWYREKFGELRPNWFVFPFGKPQPTDPTRSCTSFKTVWAKIRKNAGISGRWHDNRHTFITGLAESGKASDETIRDLAGHVSKNMLKHYSHIGMKAKREAVEALDQRKAEKKNSDEVPKVSPKVKSPAKKAGPVSD